MTCSKCPICGALATIRSAPYGLKKVVVRYQPCKKCKAAAEKKDPDDWAGFRYVLYGETPERDSKRGEK